MDYTCPHCGTLQVTTQATCRSDHVNIYFGRFAENPIKDAGFLSVSAHAVMCAKNDCKKIALAISAGVTDSAHSSSHIEGTEFYSAMVYPNRKGKPFAAGVPNAMLEDYNEACAIVNLSPKSSATLARRCLQAMIRDFCGISRKNLHQEIEALEKALIADELPKGVDVETVEAMKAVRDVGNIGAHMSEADGLIINVEAGEADALLNLIEMLFNDWYVARYKRQTRLAEIVAIADSKKPVIESKD